MNRGKTWRFDSPEKLERARLKLLEMGGEERPVNADFELWRVKLGGSTFTAYVTLKLYATPSDDPVALKAVGEIDSIAGDLFVPPNADFMVGCDEAGKGEVLGSIYAACAFVPARLFKRLQDILRTADTKARRHPFEYWKELFASVHELKSEGLDAVIKRIPPSVIDKENINSLLDKAYTLALESLWRKHSPSSVRLVIDDYGVGDRLKDFVEKLRPKQLIISHGADEKYIEVLTASVIAKYFREKEMFEINSQDEWVIDGVSPGPGSPNNPQTLEWLKLWHDHGREWPDFVRKSYRTVSQIEGKKHVSKKAPR